MSNAWVPGMVSDLDGLIGKVNSVVGGVEGINFDSKDGKSTVKTRVCIGEYHGFYFFGCGASVDIDICSSEPVDWDQGCRGRSQDYPVSSITERHTGEVSDRWDRGCSRRSAEDRGQPIADRLSGVASLRHAGIRADLARMLHQSDPCFP